MAKHIFRDSTPDDPMYQEPPRSYSPTLGRQLAFIREELKAQPPDDAEEWYEVERLNPSKGWQQLWIGGTVVKKAKDLAQAREQASLPDGAPRRIVHVTKAGQRTVVEGETWASP